MALSNLEKALIERLQEPRLDGERLIDGGLTAAANIVHEITRVMAPDDEAPADYIRRAVQETFDNQFQAGITYAADIVHGASLVNFSSTPESSAAYIQRVVKKMHDVGIEIAVNAYKEHSGFQFDTQSKYPIDYLMEMATRHKQLFELDKAVDIEPGLQVAAEILTKKSKTWAPGEPAREYIERVAGWYNQPLTNITMATTLATISGIPVLPNESNQDYVRRIGVIAKNARKPNSRDTATKLQEVSGIPFLDDKESYDAYITRVGEMAKSYKQLSEAPQAVDIRPGMEQAAMLVSSRAGMPLLPTETNEAYLVRVADQLHYALTMVDKNKKPE